MLISPLAEALGARVTGIDLAAPLDASTVSQIKAAWLEYLVLIFPDQRLDEAAQIRFSDYLGDRGVRRPLMLISNIREDGVPIGSLPDGEMMFHSDAAHLEHPYKYTLLYALEIPSVGGHTLFANLYKAYELLPDDLKARVAGLEVVHRYYDGATLVEKNPTAKVAGRITRPLLLRHSESGRAVLFVSRLMTERVVGMTPAESDALLARLFEAAERPEVVYEHVWTPGDVVAWDNRCTNHARTDFPPGERRLLRRTTVNADAPYRGL